MVRALGSKTFTAQDQRAFADASGDCNPMHMDAVAARRLLSGRQVVHGIHTLIHALNLWSPGKAAGPWRIDCSFTHPVNVGDAVEFSQADEGEGRTRLTASVDGLVCTDVLVQPMAGSDAGRWPAVPSGAARAVRAIGMLPAPLDEAPESQAGCVFELDGRSDELAHRFPHAATLLGHDGLAAVARLSYFVGMVCPGLHSVFSSVSFTTGHEGGEASRFEVRRFDPRFRLFTVVFDGPVKGELRAFRRPPPQPQPSMLDLCARLQGDEFKGTRSLVIGGSRGLGETTAKLLAAGGGDVVVSYAVGRGDAEAVAADINGQGRGHCDIATLDLYSPFDGMSGIDRERLDAVYFFATPRIYAKRNELFDRKAFDEFVLFYLQRFYELCQWFEQGTRAKPLKVYLPSTVFISDRPKGMTEYAMAKAAAEVLADDINRNLRQVQVVHSRLPRLATDQTASILQVSVASNVDTLLDVVRAVSG